MVYFSFSNIFQVRDGGSMRDPVVTINSSTTQLLSRTNYLWIRFVSTVNKTANLKASNATTFSFSLNYTTHSEYFFDCIIYAEFASLAQWFEQVNFHVKVGEPFQLCLILVVAFMS